MTTTVPELIREAASYHAVKRNDDDRRRAGDLFAVAIALEEKGVETVGDIYALKRE